MLKAAFLILFILNSVFCLSQQDSSSHWPRQHKTLKISFLGSIIYPGVSSGVEFPLRIGKFKGAVVSLNKKSVYKDRFISADLNWYHHADFHDNFYITAQWEMRRTDMKGFFREFSLGPGLSRTFLGGTTYRVTDSGNISIVKRAGYYYALLSTGVGCGKDLSVKYQLPVLAVAKINLITMFPYNSTIYFRPVLELGIRYMFSQNRNKANTN